MVWIPPPSDKAAVPQGNGRHAIRADGQHALDREYPADSEKTRPVFTAAGVTVRLSDAARSPLGDADGVRAASGAETARESLSGAAADLEREAERPDRAAETLRSKRSALTLALASGEPEDVAAAARELAEAKAEAEAAPGTGDGPTGFPYRRSIIVEEPTFSYQPDSGRYVPSSRRVALSVEKESGEASVDPSRVVVGEKGVSVIHRAPAVPMHERLAGAPPTRTDPADMAEPAAASGGAGPYDLPPS